jgi:hypothetical protein
MNMYRFAISYCDRAEPDFVGFVLVDIVADSAELASRELENSKHDQGWLLKTFGADRDRDVDGIIVGEHVQVLVTPQCVAEDDRTGIACPP